MLKTLPIVCAASLLAQPQEPRPAFEAASVKINHSDSRHSSSHGSRGQVNMENQTLKRLIERCFEVQTFQVTGPAWLEDVRLDVVAKYPEETKLEDRPRMLRTLLEDRLKLAAHREKKEMPGYALVVARSGFKLKPVGPGDSSTSTNGNPGAEPGSHVETVSAHKTTMAKLAELMSRTLNEPVADDTGQTGIYDFEMRWTTDPAAVGVALAAAIFGAVQEALGTLGLRLQSRKVPVDMIVVDHIERVPAEN